MKRSCLTCKFRKPEKQSGKYRCGNEYSYLYGLLSSASKISCGDYKPREEKIMDIEIEGKKYERTEEPFTLNELKKIAGNDRGLMFSIQKVIGQFYKEAWTYDHNLNIVFTDTTIAYIIGIKEIMPWLVEHEFFHEVEEEIPQYKVGQWFRNGYTDNILRVITKSDRGVYGLAGFNSPDRPVFCEEHDTLEGLCVMIIANGRTFTPIDLPIIIDRSGLTETDCVWLTQESHFLECRRKHGILSPCNYHKNCANFSIEVGTSSKD